MDELNTERAAMDEALKSANGPMVFRIPENGEGPAQPVYQEEIDAEESQNDDRPDHEAG